MKPKKRPDAPAPLTPASADAAPLAPIPTVRPPEPLNRGALTRIEFIHDRLSAVLPDSTIKVTRRSLARELSRSRNAINDDLREMRDTFGAPIRWCPVRGTLHYVRAPGQPPYELRPRATVAVRSALALLLSTRRLFPFGGSMEEIMRKVLPLINGGLSFDIQMLDTMCSAPESPASEADLAHLELLLDAIGRRCEMRLKYEKLTPGARPELRIVHPLHVVLFPDSCLVVVHDPACNARRNLELTRIRDAGFIGATFTPPADFDLAAYRAGSVDRFLGEAKHEVRIRFAPALASYVKTRPWQRGQLLEMHPNGSAEGTYRVAHTKPLEQRVLASAGLAEVLGPPDVRARICAAAEAIYRLHASRERGNHAASGEQLEAA